MTTASGARAQFLPFANDMIQPFLRVLVTRKTLLFGSERGRVVIAPAIDHSGRMPYVKHFVIKNEFDEPIRHLS